MGKDERIVSLGKLAVEEAGHQNVSVKCVKYGEGGPGGVHPHESAGTWEVTSDSGSFSFSLTWKQYNRASDTQIEAIIRDALA